MIKSVMVGAQCKIKNGVCTGLQGKIVAADYADNYVIVRIDRWCTITTIYENIEQENIKNE
jgi:hypothetical protein